MAKICVDMRCLSEGRRTGVEEYTLNLMRHIFERDQKNEYVLFFNSWRNRKANLDWAKKYKNVRIEEWRIPNKIMNLFFWYFGWPKIDKMAGGADVLFFPNIIFGNASASAKIAVTIHDLSFERFPEFFSWKRRLWHYIINPKKNCCHADKIIAVSDSTKNDIINIYKIPAEKIEMIHSGVSDKFKVISRNDENLVKTKNKYCLPYKFFLYLGTVEPRKNIISLIHAYNKLQEEAGIDGNTEIKKYKLIIAGEKGWLDKSIFYEISHSKFSQMIDYRDAISDSDKEYVYNLASVFIYPSYFEGFGFPPLEAMKCGVPVIAANNSSIPEIVGRAGILIDPDRPDEIKKAMKEIAMNNEMRQNLIKKGLEKAGEFDWKATADKMINIFNELSQKK